MKRAIIAVLLAAVGVLGWGVAREQTAASPAEEKAVRAVVDAFAAAFDKHDAKAIGGLFHPEAKLVTEDGNVIEGREAITGIFAALFADNPQAKIEVQVDSIKFIGTDLAVEVGSTRMTSGPGGEVEVSRYTVMHLKRDGQWRMALVREAAVDAPSAHDRLQPLAWLVGDWVDESPGAVVMTSCRWSDDKSYLLQDIQVKKAGKATQNISQRIGYDAQRKCVRSWAFDSEGGFVEGFWVATADGWLVKVSGVRSDGVAASATNTIIRTGSDSYLWRSTDRVIGNELSDPVEVRVVRRPPGAAKAKP